MPYIRVCTTQKLTPEKRVELVTAIGEALENIPGKKGIYLISDVEDGKNMYLGSEQQENMVFADVRYHGNYEYKYRSNFTEAMFDAINKVLGTSKDRMWLNITEFNSWGGFGNLKDDNYPEG
ncbi:MAG: hypothetical protein IK082_03030 [Oscillospiraceae bacterium]|nr:hypothetical protein [Oscillospiraceae bacterium]